MAFTEPDQADVPPELLDELGDSDLVMMDGSRSCLKCDHYPVCAIYSGIAPMLENWHTEKDGEGEPPVTAERLAMICESYRPVLEEEA